MCPTCWRYVRRHFSHVCRTHFFLLCYIRAVSPRLDRQPLLIIKIDVKYSHGLRKLVSNTLQTRSQTLLSHFKRTPLFLNATYEQYNRGSTDSHY